MDYPADDTEYSEAILNVFNNLSEGLALFENLHAAPEITASEIDHLGALIDQNVFDDFSLDQFIRILEPCDDDIVEDSSNFNYDDRLAADDYEDATEGVEKFAFLRAIELQDGHGETGEDDAGYEDANGCEDDRADVSNIRTALDSEGDSELFYLRPLAGPELQQRWHSCYQRIAYRFKFKNVVNGTTLEKAFEELVNLIKNGKYVSRCVKINFKPSPKIVKFVR